MEIGSKQERRAFYRSVLTLILPLALQNLINVGVSAADVFMLGKVGEVALSGASLGGQVQFIMNLLFFGLTSGAAILTAQYWGKGEIRVIEQVLGFALKIALIISVLFTVAALLFPAPIMHIFSAEPEVIRAGAEYLRVVAFSYVPIGLTMIYLNIMRSVERVVIATVVYFVSLLVNVLLNYVFIFGAFGFPAMGVRGAALATVCARLTELLIVAVYSRKNKEIRIRGENLLRTPKLLQKDFFVYALPVAGNELCWGSGISAISAIVGHLGSAVVAAHAVTQTVRQLSMVISFGVASSAAIMIGKAIGEGREELARAYGSRFWKLSLIMGAFGSVVVCVAMPVAGRFMSLSPQAREYLVMMTVVLSYFVIGQSFNTTMVVGIFRAGGDAKFGLFLDASMLWGVAILGGFITAFVLKLPVTVVYVFLLSDEVVKIPLVIRRYRSYRWVKNITRKEI